MAGWNCRLVERDRVAKVMPWLTIKADNAECAAKEYCNDIWDAVPWIGGDEAVVEVENFTDEQPVQRIKVRVCATVEFEAEKADET